MRETGRRCWWVWSVVSLILGPGAITGDARSAEPLTIRTYDAAGLAAGEMQSARESGGHILERAGLAVIWLDCTVPRPSHASPPPCSAPLAPRELVVRIVPAGAGIADHVLGSALVDRGHGVLATVYADRVRTLADGAGTGIGQLIGRAAAHEVGHLLLGSTRHASRGLMRGVWEPGEVRNPRPWDWYLADGEAAGMRRGLVARARFAEEVLAGLRGVPVSAGLDGHLDGGLELLDVLRP